MDASRFIQTIDGALSPAECSYLLQQFWGAERFNQRTADGAWMEAPVEIPVAQCEVARHVEHYNRKISLTLPVPTTKSTETFRIKRYRPGTGEEFRAHYDAKGYYCNRYLVMLWYLNDVAEGGETVFPDLGVSIKPKAGCLLMFPPHWMFQHAGLPPISGDKYILSTYLLY